MSNEKRENSSPNQLKEKIAHLKEELAKVNETFQKQLKQEPQDVSSEKETSPDQQTPVKEEKVSPMVVIEELEREIDLLLRDNARLREEKLVVLADSENLKRRVQEEQANVRKYRAAGIVEKLLPAFDNFERALQVENVTPEVKNFLMGFEMIYKLIKLSFGEEGITEIEVNVGDEFDSKIHHAIEIVETGKVKSGQIAKVLQKGYLIHDRVLRHVAVNVEK